MKKEIKSQLLKGIRVVSQALEEEDFPGDKSDLAYSVGDIEVADTEGQYFPVRDILDCIEQDEFKSAEDAVQAIQLGVEKLSQQSA
jgi:hypothetical protein